MTKPSVFVGSSSEARGIGNAIKDRLAEIADVHVWHETIFPLMRSTLTGLIEALERFDFAIIVFSPDDTVTMRDNAVPAPRMNVVFELGLFMGRLGRDRSFIVCETRLLKSICSDLQGITLAEYSDPGDAQQYDSAIADACDKIGREIAERGQLRRRAGTLPPLWDPFVSGGFLTVLGQFSSDFEQSGFIGLGDAMALGELRSYFESVGVQEFPTRYEKDLRGDDLRNNLILIGGPAANTTTRPVLTRSRTLLHVTWLENGEAAIVDDQSGTTYTPKTGGQRDDVQTDLAVIVSSPNPFEPRQRAVTLYGISGYGTWAAARFLRSPECGEMARSIASDSFECLLEADILRNTPQQSTAIVFRPISELRDAPRNR